jgi:MFS family permease
MPSMNNLLATYVPAPSRARSIGVIFSGFHGGTLLGLLLSPLVVLNFGWPALFVAYGSLGIPLFLAWQVRHEGRLQAPPPGASSLSLHGRAVLALVAPLARRVESGNPFGTPRT